MDEVIINEQNNNLQLLIDGIASLNKQLNDMRNDLNNYIDKLLDDQNKQKIITAERRAKFITK